MSEHHIIPAKYSSPVSSSRTHYVTQTLLSIRTCVLFGDLTLSVFISCVYHPQELSMTSIVSPQTLSLSTPTISLSVLYKINERLVSGSHNELLRVPFPTNDLFSWFPPPIPSCFRYLCFVQNKMSWLYAILT